MENFNESRFRSRVESSLVSITKILGTTKNPTYAADVPHTYDDKYGLANFLTNIAGASVLQILQFLGLSEANTQKLLTAVSSDHQTVTLRFSGQEDCSFVKEVTREVESPTSYVTEVKSSVFGSAKITDKVITKVTEYFWDYRVSWSISIYLGSSPTSASAVALTNASRESSYQIMTSTKVTPKPATRLISPIEMNLTWFFSILSSNGQFTFAINREAESCRTPRRNEDIQRAFSFFQRWSDWTSGVYGYFQYQLFPTQSNHGLDLSAINSSSVFVPIVPLLTPAPASSAALLTSSSSSSSSSSSQEPQLLFRVGECNSFLNEENKSIQNKIADLAKVFPSKERGALISVVEAVVSFLALHGGAITATYFDGVNYIEFMLRKQLISAIGKEVTAVDFTNYMIYHYRKFLRPQYQPKSFYYAIRRPDHYPEGILSIEATVDGSSAVSEPISTIVRHVPNGHSMYFNLNAGTRVSFSGERFLHAYILNSFEGQTGLSLSLNARARQFSCFMLVVGKIGGATLFQPKNAIIIQNKDDLKIPLLLEQLPTAKEFADATASLSPEQKRFAEAYRSMQLEGSLFGLLVIQLKPQLETLLKLPEDSLTKEIKLTQQLFELFIKYQIPSDLLTYSGPASSSLEFKLNTVKGYVKAMYDLIDDINKKTIEEEKKKAELAVLAELARQPVPSPPPMMHHIHYNAMPQSLSMMSAPRMPSFGMAPPPPMAMACASPAMMSMAAAPMMSMAPAPMMSMAPAPAPSRSAAPPPPPPSSSSSSSSSSSLSKQEVSVPSSSSSSSPPSVSQGSSMEVESVGGNVEDYTQLPVALDREIGLLDTDAALRSTIISTSDVWTRSSQANLIASPSSETLLSSAQKTEHNKALDLLDALSRSGSLPLVSSSLHVVLSCTHGFDKSLINSIVQDNINPIEKLERSSLIIAKAIHGVDANLLINQDQTQRVQQFNPKLFLTAAKKQ